MAKMKLIPKIEERKLLKNGQSPGEDHKPVVKLFNPTGAGTWLITEIDPNDPDRAFGLADLGHGSPELGWISLSEIRGFRGKMGLPIERDMWFTADAPISVYADAARNHGYIVEDKTRLEVA